MARLLFRWWWAHWMVNFLIACPLVYAALAMAVEANHISHAPIDHHKVPFSTVISARRALTLSFPSPPYDRLVIARLTIVPNSPLEQRVGYAIFTLYGVQVLLGTFIHFVRVPFLFIGHRPPQNWIHAALGFTILALAAYQVRLSSLGCLYLA